ncbi:S41 family peptidase [Candidatus Poribacteria bacterium]|jgi:carboxyl-terminal processing protease|nr:S41 family peptidase [Candidatus Poribacteria bacterium]MBT5711508.1 S41 family peptidase [Candidatus Poribacteria bacterium]MBT7096812.1 S41 family peptidase [Candidatus Poribacteria bacterium]MBT7804960.1 S41 family peptidase [Candidatus Poribacteria bacterium]
MKKHGRSLSFIFPVGVITVVLALMWYNQGRAQSGQDSMYQYVEQLSEIIERSRENYYKDVDVDKMMEGAIKGAVASLNDPYSFYQAPQAQQREREDLFYGQFGGLGIRIYADRQGERALVKVSSVLPNTPARREGIQAGDTIIEVDGDSVVLGGPTGLTMDDVVSKLRGRVGEPVTITVARRNHVGTKEITLTREVIKPRSVEWEILEPGIGYTKLDSFKNQTSTEFEAAVNAMKAATDLRSIIVDLRANRGGLLTAAREVSDAFLSKGRIVSTKGRDGGRREFDREYLADADLLVSDDVEVVILIDGNSASGSEIVAGAIKDHDRGILVGEKTFGKGVVQQRFELESGGALSLTISSYFTPDGTSIDGEGIAPDVPVEPVRLTDEEAFARQHARDERIVDDFVIAFLEGYEDEHAETPKDFAALEPTLPELTAMLEEENIHLSEKTIWLEARNIFDLNVGTERLVDRDNDEALTEALRVIQEVGVGEVLSGAYPPAEAAETAETEETAVVN